MTTRRSWRHGRGVGPAQGVRALAVLVFVPLLGCSGGDQVSSLEHTETWCELFEESARTVAEAAESDPLEAPESAPEVQEARRRFEDHGWPEELRDASEVIEQGVPVLEDEARDEFDAAFDEVREFARAECDYDQETRAFLFEGGSASPGE